MYLPEWVIYLLRWHFFWLFMVHGTYLTANLNGGVFISGYIPTVCYAFAGNEHEHALLDGSLKKYANGTKKTFS